MNKMLTKFLSFIISAIDRKNKFRLEMQVGGGVRKQGKFHF